jgi:MFS family permease
MHPPLSNGSDRLSYTRRGLAIMFLWLFWGDFAFTIFENVFGRLLPLFLRELKISNFMIGALSGSTLGLVNFFFLPSISQWSDNFRSRKGRRIPFLFWSTPLTALSVVLFGYAPEVANWTYTYLFQRITPWVALDQVLLVQICLWVFSYNFFNMILVNAFNWLLVDIVPSFIIGRFLSWFRVVGTLSGAVFTWYLFPHLLEYRKEICFGICLVYVLSFWLMCSRVQEGEYPEPTLEEKSPSLIQSFGLYFKACLKKAKYRNFYIANTFAIAASSGAGPFILLFSKETLQLGMSDIGKAYTYSMMASLVFYPLVGWLCDRVNPITMAVQALIGFSLCGVVAYFWVDGKNGWFIYSIISAIPAATWAIASTTSAMKIFPSKTYGQLSAGMNVFGCGGLIFFNFLSGKIMDLCGSEYRYIFVWVASFFILAAVFMIRTHRLHSSEKEA